MLTLYVSSCIMLVECCFCRYCPGGHGKLLEGIQDPGESWSPIIDGANDWVQVGVNGECNLWSETCKFCKASCMHCALSSCDFDSS